MKVPGHCSVTGEQCFHVIETWPYDHPFAGEPRRLGEPNPNALRVTFVLASGSQMTLTLTTEGLACLLADPSLMPKLWAGVKDRARAERKAHTSLGQTPFTDEQHADADIANMKFNDDVPIGVLCYERWLDHGA